MLAWAAFLAVAANTVDAGGGAWRLRLLNTSASARCLDGSLPGYYYKLGEEASSFVFHLQGGGWCYNETSCGQRSLTPLGSSTSWPETTTIGFALFSDNRTANPLTWNWTSIYVKYCDGSSFTSHRTDPVTTPNGTVLMRGRDILDAVLGDVKAEMGMSSAKQVIVGGCSAGGLAAYMHVDHIAAALPQTTVVKAVADAGFFIDATTVTGVLRHRQLVQYEARMFNISGGVNPSCAAEYRDGGEIWKCMMPQYVLPHVQAPVFLFNSMYDTYQLSNYFAPVWLPNISSSWGACAADLNNCSTRQEALIRVDWREQFLQALRVAGMLGQPGNSEVAHGTFAYGCARHCSLSMPVFADLTIGGVNARDAISSWFLASEAGQSNIHVDSPWPSNPFCPVAER